MKVVLFTEDVAVLVGKTHTGSVFSTFTRRTPDTPDISSYLSGCLSLKTEYFLEPFYFRVFETEYFLSKDSLVLRFVL